MGSERASGATEPPFDGGPACPACPMEVRGLYATAHNLVAMFSSDGTLRSGEDWCRFYRKLEDLRRSVARIEPLVQRHFADTRHAQRAHVAGVASPEADS